MKLVTFSTKDDPTPRAGLFESPSPEAKACGIDFELEEVMWADLPGAPQKLPTMCPTALDVIVYGQPKLNRYVTRRCYRKGDYQLHAPLPNPPRIFAIGLNYREHAIETKAKFPDFPVVFFKLGTAINAPGAPIVLPKNSQEPDYEAELAFVIGKGGYRIQAEDAMQHVFGYTILNDVSARDVQHGRKQWFTGKSADTYAPCGPWVVTRDEISDPQQLNLRTTVNGEVRQDANTRDMIFDVKTLIADISAGMTLEPGDLIATGTPVGVAWGMETPRYLVPGDEVSVEIEKIGRLWSRVIAVSE